MWQNGAVRTVGEIMDAKVNGDLVSFNISGPLDGASRGVVTFTGTRSGDTIVFSRTTERSGGIGNGLYGTGPSAPKQVTARRQPTGTVATHRVLRRCLNNRIWPRLPQRRLQLLGGFVMLPLVELHSLPGQ